MPTENRPTSYIFIIKIGNKNMADTQTCDAEAAVAPTILGY
jgi:hypothetical protein